MFFSCLESSVTTLLGIFTEVTLHCLKTLGAQGVKVSEAVVNLLISLENHLHLAAPLFNIIILPHGAFLGD